jgi:uncharacterized protein (TIRG00374 family)
VITSFKRLARYLLSLGLMGMFLYWAFRGIDSRALWESVKLISAPWVAAIVATTLGTIALRAWRWIALMRPFTREVTLLDACLALLICYAGNTVIPRSGEALRALSLNWRRGVSIGSVLGTVVVERTLDMFWLVFLIGATILLLRGQNDKTFPWMEPLALLALAGCMVTLILLVAVSVYRDRAVARVHTILDRLSHRLAERATGFLDTFVHGLQALHARSAYAEILIASLLLNAGYLLMIYQAFLAFGFDESPHFLGILASFVVSAISSLGMVMPTSGGIGSYHFFFAEALNLLYSVPLTSALACATVLHAISTATYLAFGGPGFFIQRHLSRGPRP